MTTAHAELPADVRSIYPWPGDHLTLQNGLKYHYLDEGPRDGEVMLMVHGNPTWSFYYRQLVQKFEGTHRCVVPDHIGMGLSDKPQDWPYRLQNHIDNLVQLIEHLDLKDITLVVHDWGGAIGFGAALAMPERFKRFVVFNTSVFTGPVPFLLKLVLTPGVGDVLVRGLNGFVRGGLITNVGDKTKFGGAVKQGYTAPYDNWENRVATLRFVQDIPTSPRHPSWQALHRVDEGVKTFADRPFLIVWGEKDFVFTTQFCDEWERRFPHAEVHRLPQASHFVVDDEPEKIGNWIQGFLDKHPLA